MSLHLYPQRIYWDGRAGCLRNNTMVGYAATCVRKGVISPSSSGNSTPEDALPAATNSGWTELDGFEEYQQAKRVGQIRT